MSRIGRARRIMAVVSLAVLAAACSKTLDTAGLETDLKTEIEKQLQVTGVRVDCPADMKVEQGATFKCTATDSTGTKATITVTQTDDKGNVRWEVTDVS